MSALRTPLAAAALVLVASSVWGQVPSPAVAGPSLVAARTLYASAEYGGALDMLNGLRSENPATSERQSIDLYRTLCLVAVGNSAEAARIIDGMITEDPLYRPASDDVPPRLRTAFTEARRRLLPAIVQQTYLVAKAAFDQKDYAVASQLFTHVLAAINDPDMEAASAQAPLSDLKMLATGFKDLAAKAIAPPPPPPAVAVPEPAVDRTPKIYSAADKNVVPPVAVRQSVPAYPGRVLVATAAMIDVVIDETGSVESADMETPLNQSYDRMTISAARTWQYQPATLDGKPVKFRKRIQISLVPTPASTR
jgi:hypothetical protein